jgi:hypothetical protein
MEACTTGKYSLAIDYISSHSDLLGLHFLGQISEGTQYAKGTVANPNPIRIWATITRYTLLEPGAIAAPMNEMMHGTTSRVFRAWNVSEAEEMSGEITAWTSDRALGIQVCVAVPFRSVPMYDSYRAQESAPSEELGATTVTYDCWWPLKG